MCLAVAQAVFGVFFLLAEVTYTDTSHADVRDGPKMVWFDLSEWLTSEDA